MEEKKIKKLYYSISEVSQITGLKKYILRYWETEFPDLRPGKNRAGNRIYRLNDIRTIFLIKKLLYQDKYTIEGAKQRLKELKKQKDPQLELSFEELRREDMLREIRKDLRELLDFIDQKVEPDVSPQPEHANLVEKGEKEDKPDVQPQTTGSPENKYEETPDLFLLEKQSMETSTPAKFSLAETTQEDHVIQNNEEDIQELQTQLDASSEPQQSENRQHLNEEASLQETELPNRNLTSSSTDDDAIEEQSHHFDQDLFSAAEAQETEVEESPTLPDGGDANPATSDTNHDEHSQDASNDFPKPPHSDPTDAWDDPEKLSE